MEGYLRFKIDWASLIVGSKLTIFAFSFSLYLRTVSKYKPPRGLYSEGRFMEGFLRYKFGGLIFGGAYFRNFKVCDW